MNKFGIQNLKDIIKKINRSIITSFLIILIFLIATVGIVYVGYKNNEKNMVSQKLNATFVAFTTKISQRLIGLAKLDDFKQYLHSGRVSRDNNYNSLLNKILDADLDVIAGMDILDSDGAGIFSCGIKTEDSVALDLCYLGGKVLDFDAADSLYTWKLYFKRDVIIEELKRLNPELVDCINCDLNIVSGKYFGDFPIRQFSNMKVNLTVANSPSITLWWLVILIMSSVIMLVIWNLNRIKTIFKKYLSDPIIEITSKIKENKALPQVAVEELSYLTEQIDQWKRQVIELEQVKAKERAKEEQVRIMQSIGASIAHELRTPLRSIVSGASGIEKLIPVLLKGYESAKKNNLPIEIIRPQQIELLEKVLSNLRTEGAAANTIIDMLLMRIRGTIAETAGMKRLSIANCLQEALQRYVFQGSERALVVCDTANDFQFKGDAILVVHILFNLLKNALYYIAKVRKGQIYINFEQKSDENRLYFKDTGKGIAKDVVPYIFDRFYSKTEGGVGIGLSFCKMAMEWMGGDITCQSIEGEYTQFVLHFPIIKE